MKIATLLLLLAIAVEARRQRVLSLDEDDIVDLLTDLEDRLTAKYEAELQQVREDYQQQLAILENQLAATLEEQVTALEERLHEEWFEDEDEEDEQERHLLDGQQPRRRKLATLKKINKMLACVSGTSNAAKFVLSGCNLIVNDGSGSTSSSSGKGNIIVGYGSSGTGGHNVVVGDGNTYKGYGGIVAGQSNLNNAAYASVLGGKNNKAEGPYCSILGGKQNEVGEFGEYGTIAGGQLNSVNEEYSSVLSGYQNTVWAGWATVVGGEFNRARAISSVVVGGEGNNVYESAQHGVVVGGMYNNLTGTVIADSSFSVMLGGFENVGTGAFDIFPPATDFLDGPI